MRMPQAESAKIDLRKLREYCLSPSHPIGKHKAKVFESALGITASDAELLRDWLLEAARSESATLGKPDEYGDRFQVDFQATTSLGQATIRSAWMIRNGENFPRLTTCYIH